MCFDNKLWLRVVWFISDFFYLTTSNHKYLFFDDIKLFRHMRNDDDHKVFQDDIIQLQVWVDKWLPQFHPDKYKLLKRGKRTSTSQYTMYTDDLMTVPLYHVKTSDEKISMGNWSACC